MTQSPENGPAAEHLIASGKPSKGAALWFTGLPGSGKSTIARAVLQALLDQGVDAEWLQMDERRKAYFPEPKYTDEERRAAYRMFAEEARDLAAQGKIVLMDGTAHKLAMREQARKLIPGFIEVHVRCDLETAMAREAGRPDGLIMADLYAKALERKQSGKEFEGLGQVVGVDVRFEKNPNAEITLDSRDLSVDDARDLVLAYLMAQA